MNKLPTISPFLYSALALFVIGFFAFRQTFNLSLFGDEWQVLWLTNNSLAINGQWDLHLNQAIGQGYKFGGLMIYLITTYFGSDGTAVYSFSFIFRYFAALILFYFLIKRELPNIAAFLGSLFFLLTPIGLQATDWVKNSTSYISIALLLLCINYIYNLKSWRNCLFFLLTFSLSIYVNAIRFHGIILTTTILLAFQLIYNLYKNSNYKKYIFFSLCSSLIIVFLFSTMSVLGEITFQHQLSTTVKQLFSNNLSLSKLFASIGTGLLPNPFFYYFPLFFVVLLFWKRYLIGRKYLLFTSCFHIFFSFVFFGWFLPITNEGMTTFLGIYFTLFTASTFIIETLKRDETAALDTITPFLLNVCFVTAPWLLEAMGVTDSTHRYLIYPALSLPIITGLSLKQFNYAELKKKTSYQIKLNFMGFCIILLLLLMIYLSLKSEINKLYLRHNQEEARIIWQQITPYFDKFDFKKRNAVVFFDSNNGSVTHDAITFGFGLHVGYLYKIWINDIINESYKLPLAVDSLADLKSMITDGKVAKKYLGRDFVYSKDNAFYFKIDGLKVTRIEDF